MIGFEDVFEVITGKGQGKSILFAIILLIIGAVFLLYQSRQERVTWKVLLAVFTIFVSLYLTNENFFTNVEPESGHTPRIWFGNESENISTKNYDRLDYLTENLAFAKRSFTDTPSRFDYSDDGKSDYLDRSGEYYKKHKIKPEFDTHVYQYGDMVIFRILLFYSNQRNTKHDLDYEFIEMYYKISKENESSYMIPDYVAFPLYSDFIEHPREFITWEEMPILYGNVRCLAIDPDTNAFASNYDNFPTYNNNYNVNVAPEIGSVFNYMTQTESYQFFGFAILTICVFGYIVVKKPDRMFLWGYILIFCVALMLYPLISLQYDYVLNPSFRVWVDSTPETTAFEQSTAGYVYMNQYGIVWERDSWDEPERKEVCI